MSNMGRIRTMKCVPVAIAVLLTAALAGCGSGSSGKPPIGPGTPDPAYGRVTHRFQPGVVYLDKATRPSPVVAQTATSLTLRGRRQDVKVGSIIVSTVGRGALRKVTKVEQAGGNTIATTVQAGLTEAFAELDAQVKLPFDQKHLSDLKSSVPGVAFKWVKGPASRAEVALNTLEVSVGNVVLSNQADLRMTGGTTFDVDPELDLKIGKLPGDTLPSVLKYRMGGTVQSRMMYDLKSKFGGSLAYQVTWYSGPCGPPVAVGPLVFVPSLDVTSSASGSAASGVTAGARLGLTAKAISNYTHSAGWTAEKDLSPSFTAGISALEAAAGVTLNPIALELSYRLYDVAGPHFALGLPVQFTGKLVVNEDDVEGVEGEITVGGQFDVGAHLGTPSAAAMWGSVKWKPVNVSVPILPTSLYKEFFPFPSVESSITVGDDGTAPDDIFQVSVDGIDLGSTTRGGTGAFRVGALRPGKHTLVVTCVEADDGVGTVGVSLGQGLTFEAGGTVASVTLDPGEVRTWVFNVPAATRDVPALPLLKNAYREGGA